MTHENERSFMKWSEAEKIFGELNEILKEKPLAKAVEDSRFETL